MSQLSRSLMTVLSCCAFVFLFFQCVFAIRYHVYACMKRVRFVYRIYTRKYVIEQFVKVVPMLPLMLLIAKLSVPRRLALTHALTLEHRL